MMMRQEEQITRYFEHGMSAAEEQNFLISLAASDEMRVSFRSQLELMKAVRSDSDALRSVASVRDRTLMALGLSATAVTPFIEQELIRSSRNQPQPSATSGFARLLHAPKYALGTGLFLGFISAVAVMNIIPATQHATGLLVAPAPVVRVAQPVNVQNPLTPETISPAQSLTTTAESQSREHAASSTARTNASHALQATASPANHASDTKHRTPEIARSNTGTLHVQTTTKRVDDQPSTGTPSTPTETKAP